MHYLVEKIIASKSTASTTDAEYARFLDANIASMEYTKKLEDAGKIVYHGIVAGSSSSFWIVDAATPEEVDTMVKGLPVFPHLQVTVSPLISTQHVYDEIKSFLASNPVQ